MTSATRSAGAALLLCALAATPAGAAGSHAHSHAHDAAVGEPGRPDAASRTIDVEMRDTDYRPAAIAVEAGETVRFRVRNSGELVHEFNIGTAAMHAAHRGEMQAMVDAGVLIADRIRHDVMGKAGDGHMMKHDDPNSVLLELTYDRRDESDFSPGSAGAALQFDPARYTKFAPPVRA